jgi:hypothetical protein
VNNVADFGTLEEAAQLLVPPGSRVIAAASATHTAPLPGSEDPPSERTYYVYDFSRGGVRGSLVACAKRGQVYVAIAASTRPDADSGAAARLHAVADSFRVLG